VADAGSLEVQAQTQGEVPESEVSLAVRQVSSLLRVASEPVLFARVKLTTHADPAVERPAIAQINIDLNGRLVRVQSADETMRAAIEHACDRLRIRLERAARNWAALRGGLPLPGPGEWRHGSMPAPRLPYFPRPRSERIVMRHKSYTPAHETPDDAAAEAEMLDHDFHLFREKSTGEDSVIYRRADGYRLALAHRRTRRLGPVDPSISVSHVPATRLTVTEAEDRLEAFSQPFLFFVNAETGRGNLIYHRYDGHYGLREPADLPCLPTAGPPARTGVTIGAWIGPLCRSLFQPLDIQAAVRHANR
jgi:ribosome-associated translation inhibitor RaiA